jgi:hypothetical protein
LLSLDGHLAERITFKANVLEWFGGSGRYQELILDFAPEVDMDSFMNVFNDALEVSVLVQITPGKALSGQVTRLRG